jgi:elongation factor 1-beta
MGTAALKIRIMPESPESDLEAIKNKAKELALSHDKVLVHSIEEQEVAFGLKAIIITLVWPEELAQDIVEDEFSKIPQVNSVQVIDFRRVVG